jgi:hypothetical protein
MKKTEIILLVVAVLASFLVISCPQPEEDDDDVSNEEAKLTIVNGYANDIDGIGYNGIQLSDGPIAADGVEEYKVSWDRTGYHQIRFIDEGTGNQMITSTPVHTAPGKKSSYKITPNQSELE